MHKYALANSLLVMISSFSTVTAVRLFHVVRQGQVITPTQPPATTPLQSLPNASPTPSRPPVTTAPSPTQLPPSGPQTTAVSPAPLSQAPSSSSPSPTPSSPSTSDALISSASETLSPGSITSVSTDPAGPVSTTASAVQVPTQANSSATPSPTQASGSDDGSIKSGTIIGLSVVGGIAAIAVIAFIVWKLTRKRFSDLDDTDEAIKWPELNRESHMGGDSLSAQASSSYPNATSRNASALDQSGYDPYAVPPLPQFNPNQPYRDDPGAYGASGYYDPYRGPVPQTFHDGSLDGHESIPMSTYPPRSRTRSPGPGPYDTSGRGSPVPGRASPAPGVMLDMGGRGTPVLGRTVGPGPAAAFELDRRPTQGSQYSLGGQPEMASRTRSPGPNILP